MQFTVAIPVLDRDVDEESAGVVMHDKGSFWCPECDDTVMHQ